MKNHTYILINDIFFIYLSSVKEVNTHINNLISKGKIEEAVEYINESKLKESNNADLLLSTFRLSHLKDLFLKGLISLDDYLTRINRIVSQFISNSQHFTTLESATLQPKKK